MFALIERRKIEPIGWALIRKSGVSEQREDERSGEEPKQTQQRELIDCHSRP
jgi:hypothetical protein